MTAKQKAPSFLTSFLPKVLHSASDSPNPTVGRQPYHGGSLVIPAGLTVFSLMPAI